jgi:hypothetical protein
VVRKKLALTLTSKKIEGERRYRGVDRDITLANRSGEPG